MPHIPTQETYITLLLALVPALLSLTVGDRLYTGQAYYFIGPVVSLVLCAATCPPRAFVIGCALAFMTFSLFMMFPNLRLHSGNPWAGFFHVIGLVGGTILAGMSGIVLKYRNRSKPLLRMQSFSFGLVTYLVGAYIAVQLLLYFKA